MRMDPETLFPQITPTIWQGRYFCALEDGMTPGQAADAADLAVLNLDTEVDTLDYVEPDTSWNEPLPT